jgi:hypothetical protein
LDLQGRNRFREKPQELECLPLFLRKGGPFVVYGVFHQAASFKRNFDIFLPCEGITLQYVLQLNFSFNLKC